MDMERSKVDPSFWIRRYTIIGTNDHRVELYEEVYGSSFATHAVSTSIDTPEGKRWVGMFTTRRLEYFRPDLAELPHCSEERSTRVRAWYASLKEQEQEFLAREEAA